MHCLFDSVILQSTVSWSRILWRAKYDPHDEKVSLVARFYLLPLLFPGGGFFS